MRLVLASGSPRRRRLLDDLGFDFDVDPPDVDETRRPGEASGVYVERLARDKASSVVGPDRITIAADTAIVHEGRVLGKPSHPEEARSMLRRLQGDRHDVFTGVAVASGASPQVVHSEVDVAEVVFLPMTDEEIDDYVRSGEPMDKAGAYALQGRGGFHILAVHGSPYTVIGLPIHLIPRLLARAGSELRWFLRGNPHAAR